MGRPTDEQVRAAIAGIIQASQTAAAVYNWNVLGHDLRKWPGLFRGDSGTHGWVVKRIGQTSEWKNGSRDRMTWIYDVFGFYGFMPGKTGDNSDEDFSAILDAVYEAIKAKPTLDVDEVERHTLLQYALISTIDCGEETLHFAQGRLSVELCC